MTQNRLSDLNNHLFAQLERLGDEELVGEELTEEISRSRAISAVAEQIISNASLVLKAKMLAENSADPNFKLPLLLGE